MNLFDKKVLDKLLKIMEEPKFRKEMVLLDMTGQKVAAHIKVAECAVALTRQEMMEKIERLKKEKYWDSLPEKKILNELHCFLQEEEKEVEEK